MQLIENTQYGTESHVDSWYFPYCVGYDRTHCLDADCEARTFIY